MKDPKRRGPFIHPAFVIFVIFVVRSLSDVNDWYFPDNHVNLYKIIMCKFKQIGL